MLETALFILKKYGYATIVPLSIVEGPILTVLAGFLVTLGVFNPIIVYALVLVGDIIGDSWHYLLGALGYKHLTHPLEKLLRLTPERIDAVKAKMVKHKYKTLISSKLFYGIGGVGLFAAGLTRFPYIVFVIICFAVSVVQSAFFLSIGILFGRFYQMIDSYLKQYVLLGGLLVFVIVAVFLFRNKATNKTI